MTGRLNTKLAWLVCTGVLWAWLGLFLALGDHERGSPMFELGLKPGEEGIVLKGRLAELIEDEGRIRIALDYISPGSSDATPPIPKLPDDISVSYLPPPEFPQRPRIETISGFGPIHLPSGSVMVAARDYIFRIDRGHVRIVEAPPGSPLRKRLERVKREGKRERFDEGRSRRHDQRERKGERRQEDGPPPASGHDQSPPPPN
ncbi:MAG: hypothetical protein M3R04_06365 [bacterium]|nr:hypothetical protein [bacterium]